MKDFKLERNPMNINYGKAYAEHSSLQRLEQTHTGKKLNVRKVEKPSLVTQPFENHRL